MRIVFLILCLFAASTAVMKPSEASCQQCLKMVEKFSQKHKFTEYDLKKALEEICESLKPEEDGLECRNHVEKHALAQFVHHDITMKKMSAKEICLKIKFC